NKILILIDGVQINELNSGGFYGGGQYNLANVERIEVVYGPASVIYGTNAVSGIINIITKSTKREPVFFANALFGNFNTYYTDVNFNYYNDEKDMGFLMSGMYKTTEKVDLTGSAGDYNWTDEMENFENDYSFDTKFHYKTFSAGINYQNRQSSTATHYPSVGTIYRDYGTLWNMQFINAYIKHKYKINEKLSIKTTLYNRNATVLANSVKIVTDTAQKAYFRPNYLLGAESIINYRYKEKLYATGGLIYEYEKLANGYSNTYSNSPDIKPPKPVMPEMQGNTLFSTFAQMQYKLPFNFQIVAGLRFDNSSFYKQVLTPRVGIIFNAKNTTLRVLYSEAFRAPKPWDYTDGLGNIDLKPEKMETYEFSGMYSFGKYIRAEISVYKNYLYNALTKKFINANYFWDNQGNINTDGVEFAFNYGKRNLKFYGNYTYNYSSDENGLLIPEIAIHMANLGTTYSFFKYISINLRANYIGRRKNTKTITQTGTNFIEPAVIFHSTLSVLKYKNADIQLIVKNLLDTKYYHTSNLEPERYRQPQRTIMFKLGYRVNNFKPKK
ncbi:MAG: TonB-dependent receptor, partial [Bacteroidota bacterium]